MFGIQEKWQPLNIRRWIPTAHSFIYWNIYLTLTVGGVLYLTLKMNKMGVVLPPWNPPGGQTGNQKPYVRCRLWRDVQGIREGVHSWSQGHCLKCNFCWDLEGMWEVGLKGKGRRKGEKGASEATLDTVAQVLSDSSCMRESKQE